METANFAQYNIYIYIYIYIIYNLFWPQCGFELTMFRSEDSCANQLRHPGTKE